MNHQSGKGKLFVVATPIGNLEDVTLRALRVLSEVDFIVAEDTRRIMKLLSHRGISRPLVSYREQNRERAGRDIIRRLSEGGSCALVTDSGTPCVSDPGGHLVETAAREGIEVVPVPGPSAVTALLSAAGVCSDRYTFLGFLPRRPGRRLDLLRRARDCGFAVLLFESPHRVGRLLNEIEDVFGERRIVVAREMTKVHEELLRGDIPTVRKTLGGKVMGEISVLVEGERGVLPPSRFK